MFDLRSRLQAPQAPTMQGLGGSPMPESYGLDWGNMFQGPMGDPRSGGGASPYGEGSMNGGVMSMDDWKRKSNQMAFGAGYGD